jgi:hypothetical protein
MVFRKYLELVLNAFLVRRGARHQVQQVMRVHDVGSVLVTGFVADAIFATHGRLT